MFCKSPALLLAAALTIGCGSASAQTLVRPDMPDGFVEVEQIRSVDGADGEQLISYVYRNKETGEERRVLATPEGAIRRYLIGPVKTDDPNYTWLKLPDVPCNCGGSPMHQFPIPKPGPGLEGEAYDPGMPIGKQGWNYGLGTPKEGTPPPEFPEQKAEKTESKQPAKSVEQRLSLPLYAARTEMPAHAAAERRGGATRNASATARLESHLNSVKTALVTAALHGTKGSLSEASFTKPAAAGPKPMSMVHAAPLTAAKR